MARKKTLGHGSDLPPLKSHVEIYFIQKGFSEGEALSFYTFYDNRNWENVRDWKEKAFHWMLKKIKHYKCRCD